MLILASTSRYRRAQLEGLGLDFEARGSGVDEDAVKAEGWPPEILALKLAEAKARAVAESAPPNAVVIGGDQLAHLDGAILGKPGTIEAAVAQLCRMAGRTHALLTAVAVVSEGGARVESHLDRAELTLRPLSEAAIRRYVAQDRPLDCAGSYKLEVGGAALFARVRTDDPTAITGLPLIALTRLLDRFGIRAP